LVFRPSVFILKMKNQRKRIIYAFEFPGKFVYVGLTCDLKRRLYQHFSKFHKSYVFNHIKRSKTKPKLVQLTGYLDAQNAIFAENKYLQQYSKQNWHILNKAKPGSLGGNIIKHTKIACLKNAKKYKSRREWYEKSPSAYAAALKNKWVDDCCNHMVLLRKPNGYWTKERCIEDAKKYQTRANWQYKSRRIYSQALKNKWVDDCCIHMTLKHKPNGYWTKKRCIEDAKKYQTRKEWRKKSSSSSSIATKNNWLPICCAHMKILRSDVKI
jgi:predicted GIY-YIG superfamily endonuclease